MKPILTSFILFLLTRCNSNLLAQETPSVNYYSGIKAFNLSKLWRDTKIHVVDGDVSSIDFPEPIGFIGTNYERFYIHSISVVRDLANPCRYIIQGKTRVKDHICSFTGTITVVKAKLFKQSDDPRYKQGELVCKVDFREDSTQNGSGHIRGTLTTNFYLDKKHTIHYDTIDAVGDGYANNQCEAIWTSYKTHQSKVCNWGDFRMPNCGDLDQGVGDVSINGKYVHNGWDNYVKIYRGNKKESEKALVEENRKWWK